MTLSRRGFVSGLSSAGLALWSGRSSAQGASGAPANAAGAAAAPIKLDQNENPYGLSARALKAAQEALGKIGHLYPRNGAELAAAIAKRHGVTRENILLSAGSGELLRAAVPAFVDSKRALVAGLPTFETSTRTAQQMGLPLREVPVDAKLRLDLPQMEDAAAGAGLLFFCNPNNPTGTTWPTKDCEAMIDRLAARSPETVVLMDEAYAEFVPRADYYTLAPRAAKDRRVIVTRTFSKVYGMAGMRVGYAIGHPDTLAQLRASMTSSISAVSIAAALASYGDEAETKRQVALNEATRAETSNLFADLGYVVTPSDANFILIDLRRPPDAFRTACRERGVMVGRAFPGLATHVRISIGTTDEMRRAAPIFRDILSRKA